MYITTYENSSFCKPNPLYYSDLLDKVSADCRETIMVGNDALEDLAALRAGMRVFLVTDCLINTRKIDLNPYPHGSFSELVKWMEL